MFSLGWMLSLFFIILIPSTGNYKSEATNKFLNSNDFKFLWFEAEDTIDHSFYYSLSEHGVEPGLLASPESKKRLKSIVSNGFYFNINTDENPWHKDGHYLKYEVNILEERDYVLYVRERIVSQTSPIKWRFDEGKWHSIKDFKELPNSQSHEEERKLGIRWVKYGNIFLSRGRHILQLVIEKNHTSTYFKQIDAFVLAKNNFTPNGIQKPQGTIEQIELPSTITLAQDKIINERFHDFQKGVVFIVSAFVWLGKRYKGLSKEIFILMKDLGLTFTRFSLDTHFMYSVPNIFTSIHKDKIKNWFWKNYKVNIQNQEDLEDFINSLNQKEKEILIKKFYRFVKKEDIIIREPIGYDKEYMQRLDEILDFYNTHNIKAILCLANVPRWLSSNPLSPEETKKEYNYSKHYWEYAPKDLVSYTNLWKIIIEYFTHKFPNVVQYWEVLNEPEIPVGFFIESKHSIHSDSYQREKLEIYLKMYNSAVESALRIMSPIKIGGPASIKVGEDKYKMLKYVEMLIKHCAKNNKKLDFISWHKYSYEPIAYKNDIQMVRQMLSHYGLANVELIIDEWALSLVPYINITDGVTKNEEMILQIADNNVNAAYAAAVLQTMIDNELDHSVYHCLIESGTREIGDFYPVWGLLVESHEPKNPTLPPRYIKKAIYYTFKMFNMLDNNRISVDIDNALNMGAIATKSDNGKQISLLIWNYDITERKINRKVKIKLSGDKKIKYDRYLIDSQHTLFGAKELARVENDVLCNDMIDLDLETNSVTLIRINIGG
ncbi:MAG: hypothetical protein AB1422_00105 [bacterium]